MKMEHGVIMGTSDYCRQFSDNLHREIMTKPVKRHQYECTFELFDKDKIVGHQNIVCSVELRQKVDAQSKYFFQKSHVVFNYV